MTAEIRYPVAVLILREDEFQITTTVYCALLTEKETDEVSDFLTARGLDSGQYLFRAAPEKTKADLLTQITATLEGSETSPSQPGSFIRRR